LNRALVSRPAAIANAEPEDEPRNDHGHEPAEREEKEEQAVGSTGERRRFLRKDREWEEGQDRRTRHDITRPSARRRTTMRVPRATSVSTPPSCSARATTGV